jgi:hypothetical protein
MAIYLYDDSVHKLRCIFLLKRLVQIHDVTHHFCVESDRIPHALLKFKVRILEQIFGCLTHE